ncbi:MAG: ribosomal protein [Gemmatimonadetes bacterium]|nr:ribosomal protein [Gemmatimonadota bacterium]
MTNFRKLAVWHKAHQLALRVEQVAVQIKRRNPRQIERAADSIPAAIAEGRGRATDADFAHYVTMGIGSVNELEGHVQRAFDSGIMPKPAYDELTESAIEVRKMLIGLRRTLRGEPRPHRSDESNQ